MAVPCILQNDTDLVQEIEAEVGKKFEEFECKENEVLSDIKEVRYQTITRFIARDLKQNRGWSVFGIYPLCFVKLIFRCYVSVCFCVFASALKCRFSTLIE